MEGAALAVADEAEVGYDAVFLFEVEDGGGGVEAAAGERQGIVFFLVDFQIGGVDAFFVVVVAEVEVVAAAEEAVLAGSDRV